MSVQREPDIGPARASTECTLKTANPEENRIWLGFLDTYRTICAAPDLEFRRLLEEVPRLPVAA
jgi:hypothetical protein